MPNDSGVLTGDATRSSSGSAWFWLITCVLLSLPSRRQLISKGYKSDNGLCRLIDWSPLAITLSLAPLIWPSLPTIVSSTFARQIHTFLLVVELLSLTYSGQAKSTPVYEKGGSSLTRNVGRGGGWGFWYGLLSNLRQSTQMWIIDLTKASSLHNPKSRSDFS